MRHKRAAVCILAAALAAGCAGEAVPKPPPQQAQRPESFRAGPAAGHNIDAGSGREAPGNARDEDGTTPLHRAAHQWQAEGCARLLQRGAKVDAADKAGRTPLHWAKTSEVCRVLLDHGAKLDARDKAGRTPLWTTAVRGRQEPAMYLLSSGADPNVKDKDGVSVMQAATEGGCTELARELVRRGLTVDVFTAARLGLEDEVAAIVKARPVSVHLRTGKGLTALHMAADAGQIGAARILVKAGADVSAAEDVSAGTPLLVATVRGNVAMVTFLLEAGASPRVAGVRAVSPEKYLEQHPNAEIGKLFADWRKAHPERL